jgi:arabinofuranosyltransferase
MRRLGRFELRDVALALFLTLAAAGIVIWQVLLVGDWRVDDAYITFAFSKNLARGNGLIFSYDVRVEGYTNFLWTVVNAIPIWLWPNRDPLIAARVMCFVCLAGLFVATWLLSRLFAGRIASAAAVLVLASFTDLTRATLSGLETIPHATLFAFGTYHYLRELRGERKHSLWWFSIAALTRISGMVGLAFVCAYEGLVRVLDRKLAILNYLRWAVPPLGLFGLYFAWRWWYYDLPLPTTYYAKTLVDALDPDRGARYIWDAARDLGTLPLLAFGAVAVVRRFERRTAFLASVVLFEVIYIIRVGADWMPFNRFFIPVAPLAAALFAAGMTEVWNASRDHGFIARSGAAIAAVASVVWIGIHVDSHLVTTPQEQAKLARAAHEKHHTYENLFVNRAFFDAIIRKPGEVLVTDYGGIFGYYTDASLIEMWGLCNRDIALHGNTEGINPIYGKTCIECYRKFDPDYLHIMTPIVRGENDLRNQRMVIDMIFQGWALNRVLNLVERYAVGRVRQPEAGRALFFLEKRRKEYPLVPRAGKHGLMIDYPFEPGGALPLPPVQVAKP